MKFYDCATAPSPRRVRIFLAEKGLTLTVPTVQVDLRNGEQFTPAFRALNPVCMVPVLELDSGAAITDIIAICRYFEELRPDPHLMGRSAEERAVIERSAGMLQCTCCGVGGSLSNFLSKRMVLRTAHDCQHVSRN